MVKPELQDILSPGQVHGHVAVHLQLDGGEGALNLAWGVHLGWVTIIVSSSTSAFPQSFLHPLCHSFSSFKFWLGLLIVIPSGR